MQVKMTSSATPLRGFTLTVLCPGFTDRTSPRFESWVYHITKWRAAHLLGVSDSRKSPTFPVDEDLRKLLKTGPLRGARRRSLTGRTLMHFRPFLPSATSGFHSFLPRPIAPVRFNIVALDELGYDIYFEDSTVNRSFFCYGIFCKQR